MGDLGPDSLQSLQNLPLLAVLFVGLCDLLLRSRLLPEVLLVDRTEPRPLMIQAEGQPSLLMRQTVLQDFEPREVLDPAGFRHDHRDIAAVLDGARLGERRQGPRALRWVLRRVAAAAKLRCRTDDQTARLRSVQGLHDGADRGALGLALFASALGDGLDRIEEKRANRSLGRVLEGYFCRLLDGAARLRNEADPLAYGAADSIENERERRTQLVLGLPLELPEPQGQSLRGFVGGPDEDDDTGPGESIRKLNQE